MTCKPSGFNLVIENLLISTAPCWKSCRTCSHPPRFRARRLSMSTEIIEKHDELVQSTAHQGSHRSVRDKGFSVPSRSLNLVIKIHSILTLHDIRLSVKSLFQTYSVNMFLTRRTEMIKSDRIFSEIDNFLQAVLQPQKSLPIYVALKNAILDALPKIFENFSNSVPAFIVSDVVSHCVMHWMFLIVLSLRLLSSLAIESSGECTAQFQLSNTSPINALVTPSHGETSVYT